MRFRLLPRLAIRPRGCSAVVLAQLYRKQHTNASIELDARILKVTCYLAETELGVEAQRGCVASVGEEPRPTSTRSDPIETGLSECSSQAVTTVVLRDTKPDEIEPVWRDTRRCILAGAKEVNAAVADDPAAIVGHPQRPFWIHKILAQASEPFVVLAASARDRQSRDLVKVLSRRHADACFHGLKISQSTERCDMRRGVCRAPSAKVLVALKLSRKRRSWVTRTTVPENASSAVSSCSIASRSRWLVGSSRTSVLTPRAARSASEARLRSPGGE